MKKRRLFYAILFMGSIFHSAIVCAETKESRDASTLSGNSQGSSAPADSQSTGILQIDAGHPWRPPFGLARVGQPAHIIIAPQAQKAGEKFFLAGYRESHAVSREPITFAGQSPIRRDIDASIDRIFLLAEMGKTEREIASLSIERNEIEADAEVKPETQINPIDLGAVFPPADWLILTPGQRAHVHVAAFCRSLDMPGARAVAWFEGRPRHRVESAMKLSPGNRAEITMELPEPSFGILNDMLHVSIQDSDGKQLWHKQTHVMLVKQSSTWPRFGASETKLRYDLPISVRDPKTGALSTMPYEEGWSEKLSDVVVSLPNGSRFVFWRGSSYVPFWAGRYNTGLCLEWAETGPLPEGFVDSVEPLMDKELRYGRVSIVESTAARVHVCWTYQSCDFNYKVWGDAAREDFYFYPDGFGTRVLTLSSDPEANYEISELIILAPPEGYPLDLLPPNPIRCVALDGTTAAVPIPLLTENVPPGPNPPLIYRVQFHREDGETAVYFNPRDAFRVEQLDTFRPFYDQGYMVTPAYWGSHWPLARGKTTGGAIDDRIHVSPSHNSLLSWARHRPEPILNQVGPALDTLGHSRQMRTQRWVWMIGITADPDDRLIAHTRSFSAPASLEVQGAELSTDSYVVERRAYRLNVRENIVAITIHPKVCCVNPVFELVGAPKTLGSVTLAGRELRKEEYAWDGQILWLGVDIAEPTPLTLEFGK
ncbi:MAG TPA: hypothetical protein PLI09_16595 [Candidatus Hydrogenedentes bacterium]|nr:hypothetical protein [Candidatus Hydrogenedentota bacterium]